YRIRRGMHMKYSHSLMMLTLCAGTLSACSSRTAEPEAPVPPSETTPDVTTPEAPWAGERLGAASVPPAYVAAWQQAENRATCALVGFVESDAISGATARSASFAGGWGVAYDRPGLRSAFGVAGTGVSAAEPAYHEWPL